MKKILNARLVFIPLLFAFTLSNACLNYYYTLDNAGHFHKQDGGLWHFDKNFDQEEIVTNLLRLENKLKKEHAYTLLSDYAVGLMKLGKAKEAKDILAVLYNNYPNEYKLASNLGTAYELIGEVDSALKYIKRGLKLNPNDHEGSEWIHVKILEAKQQLKSNPKYLENHSVLNLTDKQLKDEKIREQIEIQVRERFPFSPGPDAIMASLMVDLGDAYSHTYSIEYAKAFYEMSKDYFGNKSSAIDERIAKMKKYISKFAKLQPKIRDMQMGSDVKLGDVAYKNILDNNERGYEIKWDKIETNPDSLLAWVDLKRSASEIKSAAEKNVVDSLKFVKDEVKNTELTETANKNPDKNPYVIYFVLIGAVILGVALYFVLIRKK